jgi:hypothetical protein
MIVVIPGLIRDERKQGKAAARRPFLCLPYLGFVIPAEAGIQREKGQRAALRPFSI